MRCNIEMSYQVNVSNLHLQTISLELGVLKYALFVRCWTYCIYFCAFSTHLKVKINAHPGGCCWCHVADLCFLIMWNKKDGRVLVFSMFTHVFETTLLVMVFVMVPTERAMTCCHVWSLCVIKVS